MNIDIMRPVHIPKGTVNGGHMCVCETCGPEIMRTTSICPICRRNSSSVLHIYRSKYLKYKQKYLKLKNEMK